ncbi:hypothetical protein [Cellvibrio sp.]|uniref:hypothetical protein n=1 Tax=Cellvibrio sp. TaxID=1965322 RepID=UPI0039648593
MENFSFVLPIPPAHACYKDHFPDNPLVPGALLMCWLGELLKDQYAMTLAGIKQIKFLAPVLPGHELQIAAKVTATQLSVVATHQGIDLFKGTLLLKTTGC